MVGRGGLAKQGKAHSACLPSCTVKTDRGGRCAWSPGSGIGFDSRPLWSLFCTERWPPTHLRQQLPLGKGEAGTCLESQKPLHVSHYQKDYLGALPLCSKVRTGLYPIWKLTEGSNGFPFVTTAFEMHRFLY